MKADKSAEVAAILEQVKPVIPPSSPDQFISLALTNNASIDVLERLMAMREKIFAQNSKTAFFDALVRFQKAVPGIKKTKSALYDGKEQYKYADLSDVINAIKEPAAASGIAYQWKIEDKPEIITVSCHITACGHTEITTMSAAPDGSGKKNPIQSRGSAIEYMKRYTLAGALGLSISEDNDGGKLQDDLKFEDIEINATSTETKADLLAYYKSLPKKWQNDAKVKSVLKTHETFLKKKLAEAGQNA